MYRYESSRFKVSLFIVFWLNAFLVGAFVMGMSNSCFFYGFIIIIQMSY